MGINPIHSSNTSLPQQFNNTNHAILNRPGIAEVINGLRLSKKDIEKIDVHEGVSVLNVNKKSFQKIKKSLEGIETLNKEELNKLVSLLGLNPDDVAYIEYEGGHYLVKETLDELDKTMS